VSKRIVALPLRSYFGHPGSPVVAKETQAACMVSASSCGAPAASIGPKSGGVFAQGVEDEGDLQPVDGAENARLF